MHDIAALSAQKNSREFGTTQDEEKHTAIETTVAVIYFTPWAIMWQWYLPHLCDA